MELTADQKQAILRTEQAQAEQIIGAASADAVNADRDFIFFAAFDGTNNDLTNPGNPQNTNVAQLYLQAQRSEARKPNLSANYYPGPGTPGKLDKASWESAAVPSRSSRRTTGSA